MKERISCGIPITLRHIGSLVLSGQPMVLEELAYLNNQRRSSFTYNKIRRLINLVQGYQRKNRLCTVIRPMENAAEDTANMFTDVIQYIMVARTDMKQSVTHLKALSPQEYLFFRPYIDYRNDPISGDIRFHRDDWNAVIMDPFFTKKDLSDCSFIARRKFLSRTEVISSTPRQRRRHQIASLGL